MTPPITILFARRDSVYKELGCDVYDIDRDALTWPGGGPCIAHPPCRAWASLRHHAKPRPGEKEYAPWAIAQVRQWGGVLEHPMLSTLWEFADLPKPKPKQRDSHGGFTLVVDQFWFVHRAKKATRLYVCGCEPRDVPPAPIQLGEAPCTVGLWSGRDKERCRPSIAKREYESTPRAFAEWLIALAQRCGKGVTA